MDYFQSYNEFVSYCAKMDFCGYVYEIPSNISELLKEWGKDFNQLDKDVKNRVSNYTALATKHRESNSPEYLQAMKEYDSLLSRLKNTIEVKNDPFFGKYHTCYFSEDDRKKLNSLKFLGVNPTDTDIFKQLGVSGFRFTEHEEELNLDYSDGKSTSTIFEMHTNSR